MPGPHEEEQGLWCLHIGLLISLVLGLHLYKAWTGQWLQIEPIHSTPFLKCGREVLSLIPGPLWRGRDRMGRGRAGRTLKRLQCLPEGPPPQAALEISSPELLQVEPLPTLCGHLPWHLWPCCALQPTQHMYAFSTYLWNTSWCHVTKSQNDDQDSTSALKKHRDQ